MLTLKTARLRLRPFVLDDLDDYYRATRSDPDVMRFLPGGKPQTIEQTEQSLRRIMAHWDRHGFAMMAVIHAADDVVIGHCGLQYLPDLPDIEVGYALAKAYWGQGLATEAARACLRYGFETIGLDHIVAIFMPENTASERVMIKLGMRTEGTRHVYGMDMPWYTISRDDFDPGDAPYALVRDGDA